MKRTSQKEYGYADLVIDDSSDFSGVGKKIKCWMSHADAASYIPSGFEVLDHTKSSLRLHLNKRKIFMEFNPS